MNSLEKDLDISIFYFSDGRSTLEASFESFKCVLTDFAALGLGASVATCWRACQKQVKAFVHVFAKSPMSIGEMTKPQGELPACSWCALAVTGQVESHHKTGAIGAITAMHQQGLGGLLKDLENATSLIH